MKRKNKKILEIICKLLIILIAINAILFCCFDPIFPLDNFFAKIGISDIIIANFLIATSVFYIVLLYFIGILVQKKKLKLTKPKTKMYKLNYSTFDNLYADISQKIKYLEYSFFKKVELNENLKYFIYKKNTKKIKRLLLIITDYKYNENNCSKKIIEKIYDENIKTNFGDNIKYKELIIIHCYDKINESFKEKFINDVIIFNDKFFNVPIAVICENKTLYIPKQEIYTNHVISDEMMEDINFILNIKNLEKRKK